VAMRASKSAIIVSMLIIIVYVSIAFILFVSVLEKVLVNRSTHIFSGLSFPSPEALSSTTIIYIYEHGKG
jgi:hypothetical protein